MTPDDMKKAAALEALKFIKPGFKVGLGTGSTANHFIEALAVKVKEGLEILGVPTSTASADLARRLGIPLSSLEDHPYLEVTVDGTDEFDGDFNLIKGGGGALVREKIVASSSRHMVVIADQSKQVKTLGKFPLPVEVVPFGARATAWKMERAFKHLNLEGAMTLRVNGKQPFMTDNHNLVIDCALKAIPEPERLDTLLNSIPGVVDTGLFVGICGIVLMGTPKGVKEFVRK
jgi:ribose 5-phosphate isomerase A